MILLCITEGNNGEGVISIGQLVFSLRRIQHVAGVTRAVAETPEP